MNTSATILALTLTVLAAAWRVQLVWHPTLFNITPIMALAFCGAAYFRDWRFWLVPFAALFLSDLWLDHYYAVRFGYAWSAGSLAIRAACFIAALGLGRLVASRRTALNLLAGTLGCSILFYLVTNTAAWTVDPVYAKTTAGWWQAMTVGHPEFPSTLWFFRNTLLGDLTFTALFAGIVRLAGSESRRVRAGRGVRLP